MWRNMSRKLEWLLIVVALAGAVMLGGCGGSRDPGTRYVETSDSEVFFTAGSKEISAWLVDWQGTPITGNGAQAQFSIVSHTSILAPTITDVVRAPDGKTTANINITDIGTYVIKANIGSLEKTITLFFISPDAGPDRTVALGSTVTLTGNTANNSSVIFMSYWTDDFPYLLGGSVDGNVAIFVASAVGQHVFEYWADTGFNRGNDPVTITVVDPTTPPVANAGSALTVAVGDAVTLSGSASSDTYSFPLTYSWSITSLPVGSTATLTNATTVSPSFTADLEGDYVFNLVVNNGYLDSTAASVTITASPLVLPNTAPVADAGLPQNATVGDTVTLDGSASSDADSDPLTYAWTLTTLPAGSAASLTGNTTATPAFVPDVDGVYVATLLVNDGTVNSAAGTVTVTVAAVATGPITSVAALETALANNTFLVAHSSAPNGLLELYEFGSPGPGGSLFFAYISPMSAPSSHTKEWSVVDTGTYIQASETYPFFALNSAAPVNATDILTMTGYAGTNGSLGASSVENWIKVATVTTADFTGKTVMLDINPTNRYVFSTTTTGLYTDGNGNTQTFTWVIDSGGHKAVVTFSNGFTRSLYLTVRQAGNTAVREMGVISADNVGTVTDGSLQNWAW